MDKSTFQKVLRRAMLLPLVLAAALGVTLILEGYSLVRRAEWVDHTVQVIATAEHVYRVRIDQETSVRAYLLTKDERFLEPYREGQEEGRRLEEHLRQLISDDPEQQIRNQKAMQASQEWRSFADQEVAMAKTGENVNDLNLQLRGNQLMDQYRQARKEFVEREEQLRDQREARSHSTIRLVNISVVVLCILIGAAMSAAGRRQLTNL